jgi:hypothetical protein
MDTTTYVQISKEDAPNAASSLYKDIEKWIRKYSYTDLLSLDAQRYIWYHTQNNYANPFR